MTRAVTLLGEKLKGSTEARLYQQEPLGRGLSSASARGIAWLEGPTGHHPCHGSSRLLWKQDGDQMGAALGSTDADKGRAGPVLSRSPAWSCQHGRDLERDQLT